MAKNNKKEFVNAVRARGGVKYYDLGGGVNPTGLSQNTMAPNNVTAGLNAGDPTQRMGSTVGAIGNATSNVVGGMVGGAGQLSQDISGAFTAQNGYNANLAPTTQLDYTGAANQALNQSNQGYGQQQGNMGTEQSLEQQLINQGKGQGPNPAQATLNQNTEANIANQAALMAGQRGASSNAGLIARQAGQQGAQTQQNAVGQSATLQAQQQLAAQQGAAALQGQIGNQITNEQAANNQLFGTSVGANNTQNANLVSNYGMAQGLNQNTAQQNANAVNSGVGGLLKGAASIFAMADGGEVPPQATTDPYKNFGNLAKPTQSLPQVDPASAKKLGKAVAGYAEGGPVSWVGQFLNSSPNMQEEFGAQNTGNVAPAQSPMQSDKAQSGISSLPGMPSGSSDSASGAASGASAGAAIGSMAKGGKVPAMVSPGEKYLPPKDVKKVKDGKANPMQVGETIKGKAKVEGDSLKNDTVPKTLESGGIVLPRHITQAKDAPRRAAEFVRAIQAKQGLKRSKKNG